MPNAPPNGAARSAAATAPSASAPTIFRKARVTDHRINLTLYKLPQVIAGEALGEIIDALVAEHQAALLAAEEPAAVSPAGVHRLHRSGRARSVASALRQHGIATPELDARVLVGACARAGSGGARGGVRTGARRRRGKDDSRH